jgi:predicted acyltransferase
VGWGAGSFALSDNFIRLVDIAVLGEAHLHRVGGLAFDPEGLVSTLPAVATTMMGYFAGELIRGPRPLTVKLRTLGRWGAVVAGIGLLTCLVEPVNKQLWTVSYVLVTGGLAMMALAVSSWMIDVKNWRTGTFPAVVFGSNPLVAFVGSGILARLLVLVRVGDGDGGTTSLKSGLYDHVFSPLAGPLNGSLVFSLATILLWLGILWLLYRKEWFIKV